MTRRFCCSVAVDVDRFSDARLRREWLPFFETYYGARSVADLRRICSEARSQGKTAFPWPTCDNPGRTGECAGHDVKDPR